MKRPLLFEKTLTAMLPIFFPSFVNAADSPSNPFDEDSKFVQIEELRKEGRFKEADAEIEMCAKVGCNPDRVLSERAHLAFNLKEFKTAYSLYTKLISRKVDLPLSYARRARVAHALRMYDVAIGDLSFLAQKNPSSIPIKVFMGKVHFESKKYKAARKSFSDILETQPNQIEAALAIARIDIAEGDQASAEKRLYDLELVSGPDHAEVAQSLVEILRKDKLLKAGAFMKGYLERHPDQEWAYNQYAALLSEFHEPALAKEVLEKGSRLPGAHGAIFNLALLEQQSGNHQRAIEIYKTIPTDSRIFPQVQSNIGAAVGKHSEFLEVEVRAGDSLGAISIRTYGTINRWKEIEALNKETLKQNKGLTPGMRLKLVPKVQVINGQTLKPTPSTSHFIIRY